MNNQGILMDIEMIPKKNRTFLHPPSRGDKMVALIMEPNMNPSAIPADTTPFANPNRLPENQMPHTLCTLGGIAGSRNPKRKAVIVNVMKSMESPLSAPDNPAKKQAMARIWFVPNRSPREPPTNPVNIPDMDPNPQTVPIWTRLSPRSWDISLKRTGIHIKGMPDTSVWVNAAMVRTYHLYIDPPFPVFIVSLYTLLSFFYQNYDLYSFKEHNIDLPVFLRPSISRHDSTL
jgi:hypothetical protein